MISVRIALMELAVRHRLDSPALLSLWKIAALDKQPLLLLRQLRMYLALIAAFFAGAGMVFFIAANWNMIGRAGQFALLQLLLVACCLGSIFLPKARRPFALFTLLSVGALLAYIGQTYQTGADPWQLFALWAALTLPLAFSMRSDLIWTAWSIIATVGICIWDGNLTRRSFMEWAGVDQHIKAALMLVGITVFLAQPLSQYTGAKTWSRNVTLFFAIALTTLAGIIDGTQSHTSHWYAIALSLNGFLFLIFSLPRVFDILAMSITAFGLNFLVLGKSIEWFWLTNGVLTALFCSVVSAIAMLSATLWIIQSQHKRFKQSGDMQ